MSRRPRRSSSLSARPVSAALALALFGCVGHLEIEGAPCPCPDGFVCCPTLSACVASDESCPPHYPPSSGRTCSEDQDCPQQEICEVWSAQGHTGLFGPGLCRHRCTPDYPCSEGERCAPVHHDGQAMEALAILPACVPETPAVECQAFSCQACPPDRLGSTFCHDGDVWGCLFGSHLTCGITCETVWLKTCRDDSCQEGDGFAECMTNEPVDSLPCDLYPCADCPSDEIGAAYCAGQEIQTCTAMPWGEDCEEICMPQVVETCAGQCTEQDGPVCES